MAAALNRGIESGAEKLTGPELKHDFDCGLDRLGSRNFLSCGKLNIGSRNVIN
jgi:hypothetical protein